MGDSGRRDEVTGRDLAELHSWARRIEGQAEAFRDRWSGTVYVGDVVAARGLLYEVERAAEELQMWAVGMADLPDLSTVAGHCWLCDVTYGAEGHACRGGTVQGREGASTGVSGESAIRPEPCWRCGGDGTLLIHKPAATEVTCPVCDGAGVLGQPSTAPHWVDLSTDPPTVSVARVPERPPVLQLGREGTSRQVDVCGDCGGTGVVEYREVEYGGVEGGRGEIVTLSQPCDCQVPLVEGENGP